MTATPRKTSRTGRSRRGNGYIGLALIGLGLIVLGVVAFVLMAPPEAEALKPPVNSPIPAEVNFTAPQLLLEDLEGNTVSLEGLRGKFVLVNNWATWCPPCREEMPTLEAYYRKHRDQNFSLVGIEAGEPADQVTEFIEEYGLSFPVWLDAEGQALRGFFNNALPSSYLVDPGGTVVLGWTGAISPAALEQYVTPYLEE
jgi:thiol-disulfide isomerase/thioredoxin